MILFVVFVPGFSWGFYVVFPFIFLPITFATN